MVLTKGLQRQLLASVGPLLVDMSMGVVYGTSAILLAQMESSDSSIHITVEEGSWIASTAVLPMGLGCVLSSYAMDTYGRRFTFLLSCVPNILGCLLISVAEDVWTVCAGRFLTGICVGLASPPASVYISEITEPRYRGVILAMGWFSFSCGILVSHIVGSLLDWRLTAAYVALLPTLSFILIYLSPETPTWLFSKGLTAEAEKALVWLREDSIELRSELENMVEHNQQTKQTDFCLQKEQRKQLLSREFMKPFLILLMFFTVKQCSAVNMVGFYSVSIMRKVSPQINEYTATIVLDSVRVVVTALTCTLLRFTGGRPLALVSCLGTGLSLLGLAWVLMFPLEAWSSWGPVLLLIGHAAFVNVGLVQLPAMMSAELFPAATRAVGTGASICFSFLVFFTVVKTAPLLLQSLGTPGTFALYGCLTVTGFFFIYFVLPETNNKSFQQIEEDLKRNTKTADKAEENL